MMDLFNTVIEWYKAHLNYGTIMLLMAIESSFIPLPSELVIPPAVLLVFDGKLSLGLIILFSTLGCIIGALFNYSISYYLGRKIIYGIAESKWAKLFFINPEKVEKAEKYFLNNGNSSTFIGRLIPVIRHLISIPAGFSKMSMKSFIIYTAIGSAIWNSALALLSYFLIDKWQVYFKEITWGFILVGIIFVIYLIYKGRKNKK